RHLATLDAMTGVTLYSFEYDENGILSTVVDRDGLVTTIERDAAETPLAIVGPYGQRTELALDENGWLSHVQSPNGAQWNATFTPDGLVSSWTNPNHHTQFYEWDSGGRILSNTDAATGTMHWTDDNPASGIQVTTESAMGLLTTHSLDRGAGPSELRTTV